MTNNIAISHLTIKAEGMVTMTATVTGQVRTSEVRDVVAHEAARALGLTTGALRVENTGWTRGRDDDERHGFYLVTVW